MTKYETCTNCGIKWKSINESCPICFAPPNQIQTKMRDNNNNIIAKVVARYYLDDQDTRFIMFEDDKNLMYYKDGIYLTNAESYLKGDIEKLTNGDVTNNLVSEIIGHIKRSSYIDRNVFDNNDPNLINLENGLYDIINNELLPHSKDYYSFGKSKIIYDKDAKCPNIDKFIKDILQEKNINLFYEINGYKYLELKRLKAAFIFNGKPNSGKSRLLELLTIDINDKLVGCVLPNTVSNSPFGGAQFYKKSVNLVDDLGNSTIQDTGITKSVIAGGKIDGQFKYGQIFSFIPSCLCLYGTNKIPKISSSDDGYTSRFIIIDCLNEFTFNPKGNQKLADPNIMDKINNPTELAGFFNKSMDHLRNLLKNGFTKEDVDQAFEMNTNRNIDQVITSSIVGQWIIDNVTINTPFIGKMTKLYNILNINCGNRPPYKTPGTLGVNLKKITKQLENIGYCITDKNTNTNEFKIEFVGSMVKHDDIGFNKDKGIGF